MIVVRGHLGFGDCIHQRALVRDLMKTDNVVLQTFYNAMYADLVGLQLQNIPGHPPRVSEHVPLTHNRIFIPPNTRVVRLSYNAETVHQHGSILAAQYACAGLTMPAKPNFRIPVPDTWRSSIRDRIGRIDKPLMVYRPTVLNNLFRCEQRLPDLNTYAALFYSIRDAYHVVSVANVGNYGEEIVGPDIRADTEFNHGELAFEDLVGLYAEADLAFTCAGFAPVLAQAVGTPTVIVYGGHEGYSTTNIVGAHLAPTLPIEPINVCECHGGHYTRGPNQELVKPVKDHDCDKTIDLQQAMKHLQHFVARKEDSSANA